MKRIIIICISFASFSCDNRGKEIEALNQRITRLEQIVESFVTGGDLKPIQPHNPTTTKPHTYNTSQENGRCHAITKKGTQCKRKAESNGYCWQHGG